jgi:hypothetical protein
MKQPTNMGHNRMIESGSDRRMSGNIEGEKMTTEQANAKTTEAKVTAAAELLNAPAAAAEKQIDASPASVDIDAIVAAAVAKAVAEALAKDFASKSTAELLAIQDAARAARKAQKTEEEKIQEAVSVAVKTAAERFYTAVRALGLETTEIKIDGMMVSVKPPRANASATK